MATETTDGHATTTHLSEVVDADYGIRERALDVAFQNNESVLVIAGEARDAILKCDGLLRDYPSNPTIFTSSLISQEIRNLTAYTKVLAYLLPYSRRDIAKVLNSHMFRKDIFLRTLAESDNALVCSKIPCIVKAAKSALSQAKITDSGNRAGMQNRELELWLNFIASAGLPVQDELATLFLESPRISQTTLLNIVLAMEAIGVNNSQVTYYLGAVRDSGYLKGVSIGSDKSTQGPVALERYLNLVARQDAEQQAHGVLSVMQLLRKIRIDRRGQQRRQVRPQGNLAIA